MSDDKEFKCYVTALCICMLVLAALAYVNTADAEILDLIPVVG